MTKIPSYDFRRLLEETPYTDRELAEAADVSHTTVRRWRNGNATPAVAHVREVADLHDKRLNELRKRLTTIREHVGYMEKIAGLDNGRKRG